MGKVLESIDTITYPFNDGDLNFKFFIMGYRKYKVFFIFRFWLEMESKMKMRSGSILLEI